MNKNENGQQDTNEDQRTMKLFDRGLDSSTHLSTLLGNASENFLKLLNCFMITLRQHGRIYLKHILSFPRQMNINKIQMIIDPFFHCSIAFYFLIFFFLFSPFIFFYFMPHFHFPQRRT